MYRVYVYDQNNNELENHCFSNFDVCDSFVCRIRDMGYICSVVDTFDGHVIDW